MGRVWEATVQVSGIGCAVEFGRVLKLAEGQRTGEAMKCEEQAG